MPGWSSPRSGRRRPWGQGRQLHAGHRTDPHRGRDPRGVCARRALRGAGRGPGPDGGERDGALGRRHPPPGGSAGGSAAPAHQGGPRGGAPGPDRKPERGDLHEPGGRAGDVRAPLGRLELHRDHRHRLTARARRGDGRAERRGLPAPVGQRPVPLGAAGAFRCDRKLGRAPAAPRRRSIRPGLRHFERTPDRPGAPGPLHDRGRQAHDLAPHGRPADRPAGQGAGPPPAQPGTGRQRNRAPREARPACWGGSGARDSSWA